MPKNDPYQAYKQQAVMTMTPGDMLNALYDGALKELNMALAAFQRHDIPEINRSLQKVQRIFNHLRNSLDDQYEISASLGALYDYFIRVALQANLKKDPQGLEDVIQMVGELKDAYIQADRKLRVSGA
ncbi:MAG: flagellar export chaperone FliS [Peptococcaceae bacterium]|nr:flagellar export chaperone FliS [Peptococcaceae bacterium]